MADWRSAIVGGTATGRGAHEGYTYTYHIICGIHDEYDGWIGTLGALKCALFSLPGFCRSQYIWFVGHLTVLHYLFDSFSLSAPRRFTSVYGSLGALRLFGSPLRQKNVTARFFMSVCASFGAVWVSLLLQALPLNICLCGSFGTNVCSVLLLADLSLTVFYGGPLVQVACLALLVALPPTHTHIYRYRWRSFLRVVCVFDCPPGVVSRSHIHLLWVVCYICVRYSSQKIVLRGCSFGALCVWFSS